jgi:hypothetical protein
VKEPAPQPEPQKAPEPEPKQVAKTRSEPAPTRTQSNLEPTSEPIVIASSARASSSDEPASAPEPEATTKEPAKVASADNAEEIQAAVPQEPTAAENGQEKIDADAVSESQPKDRQGNVITRIFDFLFGWMV